MVFPMLPKHPQNLRFCYWITRFASGSIIPSGVFIQSCKRTSFEFEEEDGKISADILQIDARFVSLLRWLVKTILPYAFPEKTVQMVMLYTRSVRLPLEVAQNCPLRTDFYSL